MNTTDATAAKAELLHDHVAAFLAADRLRPDPTVLFAVANICADVYGPLIASVLAGEHGKAAEELAHRAAQEFLEYVKAAEAGSITMDEIIDRDGKAIERMAEMMGLPLLTLAQAGVGRGGVFGPLLKELRGILECPA